MDMEGFSIKQGCKTATEHQQEEERQRFGTAVMHAASFLDGDENKLVSQTEGVSMCNIIGLEIEYAYNTSNEGLHTFLFPFERDAAAAEGVGRSTRLLLSNTSFMEIAGRTDMKIRTVLVAGGMMQSTPKDAYLFIDEVSTNTINEILAVLPMTLDPILRNSESLRIRMMENLISFLKTEVSRGRPGAHAALNSTVKTLQEHPGWAVVGRVICDHVVGKPGVILSVDATGNVNEGSTGLTNLVKWVVNISP